MVKQSFKLHPTKKSLTLTSNTSSQSLSKTLTSSSSKSVKISNSWTWLITVLKTAILTSAETFSKKCKDTQKKSKCITLVTNRFTNLCSPFTTGSWKKSTLSLRKLTKSCPVSQKNSLMIKLMLSPSMSPLPFNCVASPTNFRSKNCKDSIPISCTVTFPK